MHSLHADPIRYMDSAIGYTETAIRHTAEQGQF